MVSSTSEPDNIRLAIWPLRELFGDILAYNLDLSRRIPTRQATLTSFPDAIVDALSLG
jgi:hypothetical protein